VTIHAFFYTISTILNPSSRKQGGKTSIKRKKIKKEVKRKKKIHAWLQSDIHCAWI
jgi:hypothetical protein